MQEQNKHGDRRDPTDCGLCATRHACVAAQAPGDRLPALQAQIRKRRVARGEVLVREGEYADAVRVVKMGTAFGYRRGLDGRARPVGLAGRGSPFGLFGVLGQRNMVTGVAASACRVCEIPVHALQELTASDLQFRDILGQSAVESCGRLATWSEAMRVRGVVNQLAYSLLLLSQAQGTAVIELPTHTALAELLGTTRETIVRGLATLEGEGSILRGERKSCEVRRPVLLARLQRQAAS